VDDDQGAPLIPIRVGPTIDPITSEHAVIAQGHTAASVTQKISRVVLTLQADRFRGRPRGKSASFRLGSIRPRSVRSSILPIR
jgi:hypothetical protein